MAIQNLAIRMILSTFFVYGACGTHAFASEIDVKHDPSQCPVGIEGHYKVSATSSMNIDIFRNSDGNLAIQFRIDGGVGSNPHIVDGKFVPIVSVDDGGNSYEMGVSAYFCQNSAIYSVFRSNDELQDPSNTTKFSVVSQGVRVEQIAPTHGNVKVWPRMR
jgi:hypothetical protein